MAKSVDRKFSALEMDARVHSLDSDHSSMTCTSIQSSRRPPEINAVLLVNYTSMKLENHFF